MTLGHHHDEEPVIGDDVTLHPGAKVFGMVSVGDGAHVGANAVVIKDVPAGYVARGVPASAYAPSR